MENVRLLRTLQAYLGIPDNRGIHAAKKHSSRRREALKLLERHDEEHVKMASNPFFCNACFHGKHDSCEQLCGICVKPCRCECHLPDGLGDEPEGMA